MGPNQTAALVWGSIKLVILVRTPAQRFVILTYNITLFRHRQTFQSTSKSYQNELLSSAITALASQNTTNFSQHPSGYNKRFLTFMLLWLASVTRRFM